VGKKLPFSTDARGALLTKLNQVLPNMEKYEWISKSSTSVNADSTPELFTQPEIPSEASTLPEEKSAPLPDSILEA
jgi:hypothetical protein